MGYGICICAAEEQAISRIPLKEFIYVRIPHQTLWRFNLEYCSSSPLCTYHMGPELMTAKVHLYVGFNSLVGVHSSI